MASTAICGRFVLLLAAVAASMALTFDEEATNDVIAAAGSARREGGEVAILIKGPQGKGNRREVMFRAMASDDDAISLYYNHKTNKISLESLTGSNLKGVSWGLGSHSHEKLILVVATDKVKLYAGCKSLHWHDMPGQHDVLQLFSKQKLKLYHEEGVPIEVYGNEHAALDALSCEMHQNPMKPPTLMSSDKSDVEDVKEYIAKDARWKREEEQMQGDDYRTNYIDPNGILPQPPQVTTQRGDIPSVDIESCDDELVRQLNLLRQTIELLRREMADQKGNIDSLRNQLRACCNRVPAPPPVERCTSSSCYPGY